MRTREWQTTWHVSNRSTWKCFLFSSIQDDLLNEYYCTSKLTWVDVFQLICLDFLGWDWLVVLVFVCISIYISIDMNREGERREIKRNKRTKERMHQSMFVLFSSLIDRWLLVKKEKKKGRAVREREWAMIRQSTKCDEFVFDRKYWSSDIDIFNVLRFWMIV